MNTLYVAGIAAYLVIGLVSARLITREEGYCDSWYIGDKLAAGFMVIGWPVALVLMGIARLVAYVNGCWNAVFDRVEGE
ncbi:MAG: hypothetical protein V1876_01225 [Candidatus Peregrinibacteria bacterium]